jgi:ATP-dependent DNA helicase RecQ
MVQVQEALSLLRQALGNPMAEFREGQWEAIDALINKRSRRLVVERTGWGKSSVYFITTRILRNQGAGPTLIISPLLALMRNQLEAAKPLGINALSINSSNRAEWPELNRQILMDEADALLISPERLSNEAFVSEILMPVTQRIGMMVVDEAHCISDWGHDFRPDYRRLVNILQRMPVNMPILGTTATANTRVIQDIQSQLGKIEVQRGSLMRESLALQNLRLPDQASRLAWLAEHLPDLPGTGIIYTLTQRDADQVSSWLTQNGIPARAYYSGITHPDFSDTDAYRLHLESLLLSNQLKALVSTSALGMGYDKPDLGFVIHYQAPGSIISYYQQVGRAGRSIDNALGILMSGREDHLIHDYFRNNAFPDEGQVSELLELLEKHEGLSETELQQILNFRKGQLDQMLKFLSTDNPAPVIRNDRLWSRTPIAYTMDRAKIRRLTQQRELEWQEIQTYIDSQVCLMAFLAQSLDDSAPSACGKCAICLGQAVVPTTYSTQQAAAAARFLKQSEMPIKPRIKLPGNAFPIYDFKGFKSILPKELQAETGQILSRWGDAGWGQAVADDKHSGHFRDELVIAMRDLIRQRWKPNPPPTWVCCIPSLNHPELVPDFAQRLAKSLGLPFIDAIQKAKANSPQKLQQNSFHQCSNLDGVFKIVGQIPPEPVLLIDDVVDSGWTLTVSAVLLRQAGSGPVWPAVLATTSATGG